MVIVKLQFNESQVSEVNNLEVTIGALKLAGRIIPQSGGYNAPQLALGIVPVISFLFQSFHCESI
jgi:hypothetical protein